MFKKSTRILFKSMFSKRLAKLFKFFLSRKRKLLILDKRQRFLIQTVLLTLGVLTTQLVWTDFRFFLVFILTALSYWLTSWSLKEDIKGSEWFFLFILPVLFTTSVSLFYFLLPARWIVRLTLTIIFAVGNYAVLLVENIYNVSSERSIQLLRAAQSVGLLLTLVILFLFANIVYSLRLYFFFNMLIIFLVSFILAMQSIWSVKLETLISKKTFIYSLLVALLVGELALVLSFWPIGNASFSLLISAAFYSLIGIIQLYLNDRLFLNLIREYIIVFFFTLLLSFLSTRWGG